MPILSIVVPIYNVEKYLPNCIESILCQTLKDFELILINDGSTDNSGDIAELYAQIDDRILVIHKSNGGVSSTRNRGIQASKGKYIGFVDPDDIIAPNMYELLLTAALKLDAEITICSIKTVNTTNQNVKISTVWKDTNTKLNKERIINEIIPSILKGKTFSIVPCFNKIYKASLFEMVMFDENKSHSEDARLNFELLCKIENLVFIDTPLYHYMNRDRESLTKKFRPDLYNYILDNKKFLINLCDKYKYKIHVDKVKAHFTTLTLMYLQDVAIGDLSEKKKLELLKSILCCEEFIEDLICYKSETLYLGLIGKICLMKNEKFLLQTMLLKVGIKELIDKVSLKKIIKNERMST
ncbi:glycosyltransferase [Sutcliffiella sp. NPDC057660]|uniref:glycosyltransferase n=1 Tax=Sutcliffiella sp. NPDC057660 TaxID=3346199 RepID=UPI0036ABAF6D